MEGILALGGMGMLFIGFIAIVLSFMIGIYLLVMKNKDIAERKRVVRCFKVVLLMSALSLLVGTGMCTLQFLYFPMHWE